MLKVHFVFLFIFIILYNTEAKPKGNKICNVKKQPTTISESTTVPTRHVVSGDNKAREKAMQFGQQIAQEAMKIASDAKAQQDPMGKLASHEAMQRLADKAEAFARQADAVLAGKVAVVEEIVQEIAEAGDVITEETASLSRLKEVLKESQKMSKTSRGEVKILHKGLEFMDDILRTLEQTHQMLLDHIDKTKEVINAAKQKSSDLQEVLTKTKRQREDAKDLAKKYNAVVEQNQNTADLDVDLHIDNNTFNSESNQSSVSKLPETTHGAGQTHAPNISSTESNVPGAEAGQTNVPKGVSTKLNKTTEISESNGATKAKNSKSNGTVEVGKSESNGATKSGNSDSNGATKAENSESNENFKVGNCESNGTTMSSNSDSNGATKAENSESNGTIEPGKKKPNGTVEAGSDESNGTVESGKSESNEPTAAGDKESNGTAAPGKSESDTGEPRNGESNRTVAPGKSESDTAEPGNSESATAEPRNDESNGTVAPGKSEPGTAEPGNSESDTAEPRKGESNGTVAPGKSKTHTAEPGNSESDGTVKPGNSKSHGKVKGGNTKSDRTVTERLRTCPPGGVDLNDDTPPPQQISAITEMSVATPAVYDYDY